MSPKFVDNWRRILHFLGHSFAPVSMAVRAPARLRLSLVRMFEDGFSDFFPRVAVGCTRFYPSENFFHAPTDATADPDRFRQLARSVESAHGSHAARKQPGE